MRRGATISRCSKYRYVLWRVWDGKLPTVTFIGLNPSTADAERDDATIRRCVRYARDWGYGGVYVVNLFAFRATDPKVMRASECPVSEPGDPGANDRYLRKYAGRSDLVVAAWGAGGSHMERGAAARCIAKPLYCLALTKDGHPGHPLRLRADLLPKRYRP